MQFWFFPTLIVAVWFVLAVLCLSVLLWFCRRDAPQGERADAVFATCLEVFKSLAKRVPLLAALVEAWRKGRSKSGEDPPSVRGP